MFRKGDRALEGGVSPGLAQGLLSGLGGGEAGSRPDRGGEGSGGTGVNRYREGLRLTPQEGDTDE